MIYFFHFIERIYLVYLLFESSLESSVGMHVFLLFPTTVVFIFMEVCPRTAPLMSLKLSFLSFW